MRNGKWNRLLPAGLHKTIHEDIGIWLQWDGNSHDENTWEMYNHVAESSLQLPKDFDGKNPTIERDGHYGKKKCL
jgi:hypothetical protein